MEWFIETLHPGWRQGIKINKLVFREKTEHQDLMVFDSDRWGRVLCLDGVVQTTTGDEFAYHEMIAHTPIMAHGRARSVCVVGGGDGGTVREVMRHNTIERVVHAELDEAVVEFSKKYLPSLSNGAFSDPRLEFSFGDAADFMRADGECFDVIIVDSTDPIGPGSALFTQSFYADCRRRLKNGGILVNQSGNPAITPDEFRDAQMRKRAVGFCDVSYFLTSVPTYIGGMMALGWASDDLTRRRMRADILHARPFPQGVRYYTPDVHIAAFAHPQWMSDMLES